MRSQWFCEHNALETMKYSNKLVFFVNGKQFEIVNPDPRQTLLQFLRQPEVGLYGCKPGCLEGGCGSCTVVVAQYDESLKHEVYRSVNACLFPLCGLDGKAVTTVEGLGTSLGGLHAIQERIAHLHGTQCGYCTPGFVMAAYCLIKNNPSFKEADLITHLDGNLCRCTGYRPILDAIRSFSEGNTAEDIEDAPMCPNSGKACSCNSGGPVRSVEKSKERKSGFKAYDPSQDPAFPAELVGYKRQSLEFKHKDNGTWFAPTSLPDLLVLRKEHPDSVLVVGNTEVALDEELHEKKHRSIYLYVGDLAELSFVKSTENGIEVGACITMSNFKALLEKTIAENDGAKTTNFAALVHQLNRFGNQQVRNVASLSGNVVTASICGDINPVLMAAGATLVVLNNDNQFRTIEIKDWILGYHQIDLKPDEILYSVHVPFSKPLEYALSYKCSRRRRDDLSIVNAGFNVALEKTDKGIIVNRITLAFGGMSTRTVFAPKTAEFFKGKLWNEETFNKSLETLAEDLPLAYSRRTSIAYRRCLTSSLFFKFFVHVCNELGSLGLIPAIDSSIARAGDSLHNIDEHHGKQHFEVDARNLQVGLPFSHKAAEQHVTGEAVFVDDTLPTARELYAVYIRSKTAHAKLISIDYNDALKSKGVVHVLTAQDIPGQNEIGVIDMDEEVFASKEILYWGQPVGIVIAESVEAAKEGAKMVKIEFEELPAAITIEDADKEGLYVGEHRKIERGNVEKALSECDQVVEGTIRIGGQHHFYIENQGAIAYPGEHDEVTVHSITQGLNCTQKCVASFLGVLKNKVLIKTRRLGGSFGGKETRSMPIACSVALAARVLRRPVRMCLEREEDMQLQGKRHPVIAKYKAGFNKDGKVLAFEADLAFDAGCSLDLSESVMELGLLHCDNCYNIPNFRAKGRCCKTNRPSNTAFRGFGRPQSVQVIETVMERVAEATGLLDADVRAMNLYREGDCLPSGMKLDNVNIGRMLTELRQSSDYEKRRNEVIQFNKENKWVKRGIALMPFKHGIAFIEKFLNQAGCLVHIYTDGTVLVTITGTEMGQGLYTKMAQVAASALKVPLEMVHIVETTTDKVPNQTVTAASSGADLSGGAIVNACKQLNERIDKIRAELPSDAKWPEIIDRAYMKQTNLSANGFFTLANVGWRFEDPEKTNENPFPYLCYGCSCATVEVDTLTGDYRLLRVDILQDVGRSLNPAIDIGQLEGAFLQGTGYYTLEELVHMPDGQVITTGPSTYKPPTADEVPLDFRISLLTEAPNERAVYSSKAIGEPPFTLAYSVHLALRHAISAARSEREMGGWFALDSPLTSERIRMACVDAFTKQFEPNPDPLAFVGLNPASGCMAKSVKKTTKENANTLQGATCKIPG